MQCNSTHTIMSSAISRGNFPREVPPYFCTTQLAFPGRSFSCMCGILCSKPLVVIGAAIVCCFGTNVSRGLRCRYFLNMDVLLTFWNFGTGIGEGERQPRHWERSRKVDHGSSRCYCTSGASRQMAGQTYTAFLFTSLHSNSLRMHVLQSTCYTSYDAQMAALYFHCPDTLVTIAVLPSNR